MTYSWRDWEGRTVDGKFVLENYLGGSENSAVFRTRAESGEASDPAVKNAALQGCAIKLVSASGADAESQLRHWQAAIELSQPNLLRVLKIGRATVDGAEVVYAVEELAEENLAQIVPERALTPDEARTMLPPVLAALEYVHGRRLVHGRIRPSNILAAGDQIKLSSDSLSPAREIPATVNAYDAPEVLADGISPASDMWSLGMTLVEVLTQRVPAWDPARMAIAEPGLDKNIPEPFRGIAQRCLQADPEKRAGLREIVGRLEGTSGKDARPQPKAASAAALAGRSTPVDAVAASARKRANGPYWLVLAIAIIVIIFLIVRPKPSTGPSDGHPGSAPPQTSASQTAPGQATAPQTSSPRTSPPESTPQTQRTAAAEPPPAQPPSRGAQQSGAQKTADEKGTPDDIVELATPQVSASARRTIHGKIKVRVRVDVDAAGNVTEAKLKDAGPSQYFAREALAAARRWKFAPAPDQAQRNWTLLFAFTRARTDMTANNER